MKEGEDGGVEPNLSNAVREEGTLVVEVFLKIIYRTKEDRRKHKHTK